jgi:hypothetical protein
MLSKTNLRKYDMLLMPIEVILRNRLLHLGVLINVDKVIYQQNYKISGIAQALRRYFNGHHQNLL